MSTSTNLKGFCAAPWAESVLYSRGELMTCCRSGQIMGNWQQDGLEKVWHNDDFQAFRKTIIEGQFPDEHCLACYRNGTARSLESELISPFRTFQQSLYAYLNQPITEIDKIEALFNQPGGSKDDQGILPPYFSALASLMTRSDLPANVVTAIKKLETIGQITQSYIDGDLTPQILAPFRQVRLVAKCNARCIQCPGGFSGEIKYGPGIDPRYIDNAFCKAQDIVNFFMNGSEFLFYKDWKKIAQTLVENGVKLSISTNGILLNRSNIEYLIDHQLMHTLNLSIDGACGPTVESIRRNVSFSRLVQSIAYLFEYATKKSYDFTFVATFVLMKRNYTEFPKLVELIHNLRGDLKYPRPYICCQALENFDIKGYRNFVLSEHHSLIPPQELSQIFETTHKVSQETGIPVFLFYNTPLDQYLERKDLPPPLMTQEVIPKTITEKQPELESHKGIFGFDPLDLTWQTDLARNFQGAVDWHLKCQQQDLNKAVDLYLMVVIKDRVYVAVSDQGNAKQKNTSDFWQMYNGPLEKILLCEEIPSMARIQADSKIAFSINLGQLEFDPASDHIDVWCGYATQKNLSDFTGRSFRVV